MTSAEIEARLAPFIGAAAVPNDLYDQLERFLALLLRWNARTNLTAIRDEGEIVDRHFGESLFCGLALRARLRENASVLDYGSGAGFPGIPVQLVAPEFRVVLAESQGKKATFLREAVRTLGLTTEVWGGRVDAMPPARRFDCVALRAVDNMGAALVGARDRLADGGTLAVLATEWAEGAAGVPVPGGNRRMLYLDS